MQCGIKGVLFPQAVFFTGLLLDFNRQRVVGGPEIPLGLGNHGRSERFPCLISASTLFNSLTSFPAAQSRFICASHSSSSQSCKQRANSARSSSVSLGMAALISSTVMGKI